MIKKLVKNMSTRNAEAIAEIFYRYDSEHTGKISKSQLRSCISDLNGRQIDETELNNISDLMEVTEDGNILLSEFTRVIETFFKYC